MHVLESYCYALQPDVATVYLLTEVVTCLASAPVSWLPVLRHHSLVTMLVRMMDEHLRLRTDAEFIEATLGFFLALSRTKPVSKATIYSRAYMYSVHSG